MDVLILDEHSDKFQDRGFTRRAAGWVQFHSRRMVWMLAWLLLLWGQSVSSASSTVTREDQLKAAFLYNFTKFTEWPTQAFTSVHTPFIIGVVGNAALHAELEKLVQDRTINGRKVLVQQINLTDAATLTHLLFIGKTGDAQFAEIQRSIAGRPILTVGESDSFRKQGGMITFLPEDNKIRFEINITSAERSGLKISSQLQKLAKRVYRQP